MDFEVTSCTDSSLSLLLEASPTPYVIIPCTQSPKEVLPYKLTATVQSSKDPDAAKPSKGDKLMQLLPCSNGWRKKIIKVREAVLPDRTVH